jgi:hypothetical protein
MEFLEKLMDKFLCLLFILAGVVIVIKCGTTSNVSQVYVAKVWYKHWYIVIALL